MTSLTLGDLIDSADRYLHADAGNSQTESPDAAPAAWQLHRLVTAMVRCLNYPTAHGPTGTITAPADDNCEREASDLRDALRLADDRILAAAAHLDAPDTARASAPARQVGEAADALTASADLLATHVATSPDGRYIERSPYARLLTSRPIRIAVTAQVGQWGGHTASLAAWLAQASDVPPAARAELAAASAWLWTGQHCARRALSPDPEAPGRMELLRAIPLATAPARNPPQGGETAAELHAGIVVSADRLRAAAFGAVQQPPTSPGIASPAWLRNARAAAVTCHLAGLALQGLAQRSPELPGPAVHVGAVDAAASHLHAACSLWEQITVVWQAVTTDTTTRVSAATTDTTDLVLRLGRLVFGNPQWTPAFGQRAPLRSPASIAPDRAGFTAVLSAVHHAADALAWMASADLDAVVAAGRAGRLYMPNRILDDEYCPPSRRYVRAPRDRVWFVQQAYVAAVNASLNAAKELDRLAVGAGMQTKFLAFSRSVSKSVHDLPQTAVSMDASAIAQRMPYFTRPKRAPGQPREQIDANTVIRAYQQEKKSLKYCADLHMTTIGIITAVLSEHGIRIRPRGPRERPGARGSVAGHNSNSDLVSLAEGGRTPHAGPIETAVTMTGTSDPGLILQAAAIDQAAASVVTQAATQNIEGNEAVRLAASSFPRSHTASPLKDPQWNVTAQRAAPSARSVPERPGRRNRGPA